jgi:hypothetical protein
VTDADLRYLIKVKGSLTFLDLRDNAGVTDRGLGDLKALTNLAIIRLDKSSITATGRGQLQQALPRLTFE